MLEMGSEEAIKEVSDQIFESTSMTANDRGAPVNKYVNRVCVELRYEAAKFSCEFKTYFDESLVEALHEMINYEVMLSNRVVDVSTVSSFKAPPLVSFVRQ